MCLLVLCYTGKEKDKQTVREVCPHADLQLAVLGRTGSRSRSKGACPNSVLEYP